MTTPEQSFAEATAGMITTEDFVFGRDVRPSGSQTAISNIQGLRCHFNAYSDNARGHRINSELQSYQEFERGNHLFPDDSLDLVATVDPGHSVQPTCYCPVDPSQVRINTAWPPDTFTPMTAFPGAPLPEKNTLMTMSYAGTYLVAAIRGQEIALHPWFSGTKNYVEGYTDSAAFLPIGAGWPDAVTGNSATLSEPLPSFVREGYFCLAFNNHDANTDGDSTVLEVAGNRITVDRWPEWNAPGYWLVFFPPVRSAQIWRRNYCGVGSPDLFNNVRRMALRFVIELPDSKGTGWFQAAQPPPNGAPIGAWAACWGYSGTGTRDANGNPLPYNWDEWDVVEYWLSQTQRFSQQSSNTHGPTNDDMGATNFFLSPVCGQGSNPWMCNLPADLSGAPISVGMLQDETSAFFYLNDKCWRATWFKWTSKQPPQWAVNLATGSIRGNYGANTQLPLFNSAFPYRLRLYQATQMVA